jgi:hypothetical protein
VPIVIVAPGANAVGMNTGIAWPPMPTPTIRTDRSPAAAGAARAASPALVPTASTVDCSAVAPLPMVTGVPGAKNWS